MAASADLIFLAIGYLLLKHAIADFTLQTSYQVSNKMNYGHPGGILTRSHTCCADNARLLHPTS